MSGTLAERIAVSSALVLGFTGFFIFLSTSHIRRSWLSLSGKTQSRKPRALLWLDIAFSATFLAVSLLVLGTYALAVVRSLGAESP